jgi:ATP-dependent DNA helicase RecG
MNGVQIIKISAEQVTKILRMEEGHFVDLKSINISPAKLTGPSLLFLTRKEGSFSLGSRKTDRLERERGADSRIRRPPIVTFKLSNSCFR